MVCVTHWWAIVRDDMSAPATVPPPGDTEPPLDPAIARLLADVRGHRLPNAITLPLLAVGAALAPTVGTLLAVLATVLCLGLLHAVGGLGLGDVKLQAALAPPLAALGPEQVAAAPAVGFAMAGVWVLVLRVRGRVAFGPFLLAGFWLVL